MSSTCLVEHALWSATGANDDGTDPAVDQLVASRWADHGEVRETRRILHAFLQNEPGTEAPRVRKERELEKAMVYGASKL